MGNFCFFNCGPPPGPPPTPSPTPAPTPAPVGPSPTPNPVGGGGGGGSAFDPVVQGIQPNCFNFDASRFNICLDLDLSNSGSFDAFESARNTWQRAIVGQENSRSNFRNFLSRNGEQGLDYASSLNEIPDTLDDVFIAAFEENIDGSGNVLGFAGPNFIYSDTGLTMTGSMTFDSSDVNDLLRTGEFQNTVLHEMAHVLGIGTLWESQGVVRRFRPIFFLPRVEYEYNGDAANAEWRSICGNTELPIETDGGEGTAGGHWDETCLRTELMTGFLDGASDPLSRITIASLQDLGYAVDLSAGEPFSASDVSRDCCNGRRALRNSEQREFNLPALGPNLIRQAAQKAYDMMLRLRSSKPDEMPDGVSYVGGEAMIVFVRDSDGNVRDLAFRWEDISDLF